MKELKYPIYLLAFWLSCTVSMNFMFILSLQFGSVWHGKVMNGLMSRIVEQTFSLFLFFEHVFIFSFLSVFHIHYPFLLPSLPIPFSSANWPKMVWYKMSYDYWIIELLEGYNWGTKRERERFKDERSRFVFSASGRALKKSWCVPKLLEAPYQSVPNRTCVMHGRNGFRCSLYVGLLVRVRGWWHI
jgi:hypothetical protein